MSRLRRIYHKLPVTVVRAFRCASPLVPGRNMYPTDPKMPPAGDRLYLPLISHLGVKKHLPIGHILREQKKTLTSMRYKLEPSHLFTYIKYRYHISIQIVSKVHSLFPILQSNSSFREHLSGPSGLGDIKVARKRCTASQPFLHRKLLRLLISQTSTVAIV
jgi:hypothetical protein